MNHKSQHFFFYFLKRSLAEKKIDFHRQVPFYLEWESDHYFHILDAWFLKNHSIGTEIARRSPLSQLIMTYVCIEVLLVVALLSFSQAIFKKHFKENPYFRNKLFEHTTQYFAESVSMCSSHCGQCCECFGFNVINKTCRVPVSCDPGVISGQEDGWIYFTEHVTGKSVHIFFLLLYDQLTH